MTKNIFMLDVENTSLHGEAFAFAVAVMDPQGKIIDKIECLATEPMQDSCQWVRINVIPNLSIDNQVKTGLELRNQFYDFYKKHKDTCTIWADCAFPVETSFLSRVANDDLENREFDMPYPLMDVANFVDVNIDRNAQTNIPLRKHHPYDDCIASLYALKTHAFYQTIKN